MTNFSFQEAEMMALPYTFTKDMSHYRAADMAEESIAQQGNFSPSQTQVFQPRGDMVSCDGIVDDFSQLINAALEDGAESHVTHQNTQVRPNSTATVSVQWVL